jgi:PAS domain S-box-containing protein
MGKKSKQNFKECKSCVEFRRGAVWRYGFAVVITALAALLRWSLPEVLSETTFLIFYPVVVAAAMFGGMGPGLVATFVSILFYEIIFDPLALRMDVDNTVIWARLLIFASGGVGISVLAHLQRLAQKHERQRADEVLQNERQYRILFENAAVGMLQLDPEGRFIRVNDRYCEITGYSREELKTMTPLDLSPPENLARDREYLMLFLTGRQSKYEIEKQYVRKNGQVIWVHVTAGNIRDVSDKNIRTTIIIQDITERKRAEEALRESERRYSALFANKINGIVHCRMIMDEQGKPVDYEILQVNNAYELITGIRKEDIRGRRAKEVFPEIDKLAFDYIGTYGQIALEGGEKQFVEFFAPIGRWLSIFVYSPKPGEFTVIFADVTAQRQAQDELRTLKDQLEQRVKERTAELEQSIVELERSNADLQQFAYVSSHDLQEPLRMVASFVQLLEMQYSDKIDEQGKEYIKFAVEGVKRMQSLIKGLLAYSRIQTRSKAFEPVDLEKILQIVKENLKLHIEETGAEIVHDPLPVVMGDDTQLIQVFQNLIDNALKFRRANVTPKIFISAEKKERDWLFCVHDNGIGIAPEFFDRIFAIFQRLHARGKYPGSGIGLSIVKRIIERHGGTICVDSHPDKGTSFFFTIARSETEGSAEVA